MSRSLKLNFGQVAELVYALVLGTSTERFKSSSLFLPTINYESNNRFQKRSQNKS